MKLKIKNIKEINNLRFNIQSDKELSKKVKSIIKDVKNDGDKALIKFNTNFDNYKSEELKLSQYEINRIIKNISLESKNAIDEAYKNIYLFHKKQIINIEPTTIVEGVTCQKISLPIDSVGIYVPKKLVSSVLMQAIPAQIANCPEISLITPPPVSNEIIYAAYICGVHNIFKVGGAQGIAALAYGTSSIKPVNKIFGPGNAYVTEAKQRVIKSGVSIDFPAGPSEVAIIADEYANPRFIAADLLSQIEHGEKSISVLFCESQKIIKRVDDEIRSQIKDLSNYKLIQKLIKNIKLIHTESLSESISYSNFFAPEHLIIQTKNPRKVLQEIKNAGSIFLGEYSPESAGDYASGTNHVLPTYGYAKTYSGLGVMDFMKKVSVQEITKCGLKRLSKTIQKLASIENLPAHNAAVQIRIGDKK